MLFCSLFLQNELHAQYPSATESTSQRRCPNTCPPCAIQDPLTCECDLNTGLNECVPFSCDDGDPCTSGDVEFRNCDDSICEPCAGNLIAIESIVVVNMRDCDDQGNTNPNDDTFVGDIVVTFNHAPVIEDFIITGDAYFSFRESFCIVNGNTITIEARTFDADGGEVLCVEPSFINTDINGDEVFVTWGTQPSDVGYEYRFRALVGGSFRGGTTRLPMVQLCELGMNKAFEIQVRSLCCEADWSVFTTATFATGDFMRPCSTIPSPDLGCIFAITVDQIFDCFDNGSVFNTADDFLEAKVTVHFGEELPTEGVLELSGMVSATVDLARVSGPYFTFPGRLKLRYNSVDFLTAVIADLPSKHADRCPINVFCSYTDNEVFVCDPCTPNSLDIFGDIFGSVGSRKVATDLNVFQQEHQVDLEWLTDQSDRTSEYIVERSIDGTNFELLAEFKNTGTTENYFNTIDEAPELGANYYRLKEVFEDGNISYSSIKAVNFEVDLEAISIFPNPAQNELFVDLNAYQGQEGHMIISNQLGQIMEEITYDEIPSDVIRLDFSKYTHGLYFIQTKIDRSEYVATKVLVSKM